MDNSVAQQVAIINNLISLASITCLRILAFSFYMSNDVFGKHWFKVFSHNSGTQPCDYRFNPKIVYKSSVQEELK